LYILKLSDNEYIEKFDLSNREVWTTDDKHKAKRFKDHFSAVFYADKFACDAVEIEKGE
jgi:hypothetical protein